MAAPTELHRETTPPGDGQLYLYVMSPDTFRVQALVEGAVLVIGRDEDADIRLADAGASRRHAQMVVGASLSIEDLGSANGTMLREERLEPGSATALQLGEAVAIGSTILMVQRRRALFRPRRLWPHGYFEARLEEECERAEGGGAPFAVVRARLGDRTSVAATADALSSILRPGDVLALYGPCDLEILLVEASPVQARGLVEEIEASMSAATTGRARLATALYPRDGRSVESLLAAACAGVTGQREAIRAPSGVVVQSEGTVSVYELARKAARGKINVLITGETGTGKELLARYVHEHSPRAAKALVCINCAALSETLLESELFGYERGAFTGAAQTKPGLLETAEGGTVFLDEIGEMSLGLQAKILRVIEQRMLTRVGGLKPHPIDVRFVAATNRDLDQEVSTGDFRGDLFYRLNGISLALPPLRERPEEVEPLARAFVVAAAQGLELAVPALSKATLAALQDYCWPGNVRELRNMMERAVLLCEGGPIEIEHLQLEKMRVASVRSSTQPRTSGAHAGAATDGQTAAVEGQDGLSEKEQYVRALARCGGNQSRAAQLLGIPRRTFCRRVVELGIPRPRESAI